jgi:serine/tyrosine/threonine adenylyltransferase
MAASYRVARTARPRLYNRGHTQIYIMNLTLKNTFINELPADGIVENYTRQVENAAFSYVLPIKTAAPKLIHINTDLAQQIGLNLSDCVSDDFLQVFTGNKILANTKPYAMCYGGHQFGQWAGQLGDGRAINLFEVTHKNKLWAVQLKGAGPTPYSRRGDGFAVLRSSIREYLCSEAMYFLGIPTTRALSLALTGDSVLRDVMYNGNAKNEKGAIVCRVSPSFIRFGNFEIYTARGDFNSLKLLTDYTITHFFSNLLDLPEPKRYLAFFKAVCENTLQLMVHWQRVGFVHGVMNTDNMSVLGLTIDYGPYGWLDDYNPKWTPNTTDNAQKRYRFENQPRIALWNLLQLANALYPLINDAQPLEAILNRFQTDYSKAYLKMMTSKIGLFDEDVNDVFLIEELEKTLSLQEIDMTLFYRELSSLFRVENDINFEGFMQLISVAFYTTTDLEINKAAWKNWFLLYENRLKSNSLPPALRKQKMDAINPKYVLRNYLAQMAIDAAEKGDFSLVTDFFEMLKKPYEEQPVFNKWYQKRPDWAKNKIGCSQLSCSS